MEKYKDGTIIPIGDNDFLVWDQGVRKGGMMNVPVMQKNLLDFKRIMDKYNIRFMPIFGTLLGLIRQGDVIPYDTDSDFACWAEDHRKMEGVISDLKELGFYIPDRNACPLQDHFIIREGEKIELWWFIKIDKERIYSDTIGYKEEFFNNTKTIQYLNETWKIPQNPEEFLNVTYGPTWVTPDPTAIYKLNRKVK